MSKLHTRYRVIPLLLLLSLPTLGEAAGQATDSDDDIRPTMHGIFQALTTAFPLSLNKTAFHDIQHRQKIQKALRQLADNTDRLAPMGRRSRPILTFFANLCTEMPSTPRRDSRAEHTKAPA